MARRTGVAEDSQRPFFITVAQVGFSDLFSLDRLDFSNPDIAETDWMAVVLKGDRELGFMRAILGSNKNSQRQVSRLSEGFRVKKISPSAYGLPYD